MKEAYISNVFDHQPLCILKNLIAHILSPETITLIFEGLNIAKKVQHISQAGFKLVLYNIFLYKTLS